jgi:spore coat polysaccharide biosynthesis predicted glycosyltransferase SpsG
MSPIQNNQTVNELLFGYRKCDNNDMTYLIINNHFECAICEKNNDAYFTKTEILCKDCYTYLDDKTNHCKHEKNKLMCFECSGPEQ